MAAGDGQNSAPMPRIVTYNVHRCVGTDRRLDVGRVADVIAELQPDIVALQELDVGRARTGDVDQAHEIAQRLEMSLHFHAALKVEEELYGDAILTAYPERLVKAGPLPGYPRMRGAGAARRAVGRGRDRRPRGPDHQHPPGPGARASSSCRPPPWPAPPGWIIPTAAGPTILLGDFNATATSVVYRTLTAPAGAGAAAGAAQAAQLDLPLAAAGAAHRPHLRQRRDRGRRTSSRRSTR